MASSYKVSPATTTLSSGKRSSGSVVAVEGGGGAEGVVPPGKRGMCVTAARTMHAATLAVRRATGMRQCQWGVTAVRLTNVCVPCSSDVLIVWCNR